MDGRPRGPAVTDSTFHSLGAAVADDQFPDVDLMLRRGRHVGRDDGAAYDYLVDAQAHLEGFYRRIGCELVQQSDGYFYLLPSGDRLGRRHLSAGEMLVGQTLALLYLDPTTLQHGGTIAREALLQRLSGLLGADVLVRTLNPRKRKYDERVAAETVRTQVGEALRRLADLGFVDVLDEARLRLRPALMRFAEPVRGLADTNEALERLVRRGEVLLGEAAGDAAVDERDDDAVSEESVEVNPDDDRAEEATP
jgi:chromosome partition protein MukE